MNTVNLGKFLIASGKIAVTDPTYSPETWCQAIVEVAGGEWKAEVIEKNGAAYAFQTVNCNYDFPPEKSWERSTFEIGIDSGVIGFYDACKYLVSWTTEDPAAEMNKILVHNSDKDEPVRKGFYRGTVCHPGVNNDNFNLYVVKADNGTIVGLRVKFIY
jgi:hypothetical protein